MTQAPAELILASGSLRRLTLLRQIGIVPNRLMPAGLEEAPEFGETPRIHATRLARTKAALVRHMCDVGGEAQDALILGADTVVACGRQILPKAETSEQAENCLKKLSGRTHRVYTDVCVSAPGELYRHRLVESRVKFKRLSSSEIDDYLASGEWQGMAGGYAIQGLAGAFVIRLIGSYSNVVGLPLYQTASLLGGLGYAIRAGWAEASAPDQIASADPEV